MTRENTIPYPQGAGRWLLRLPVLLYRMGMGDTLNAARIMILGTRGRASGLPRYTAIEYRRHGSKIYLVSAWGDQPDWVRNLTASPNVLVQQGRRAFGATAQVVTNAGEALRVLHLFRRRAPFVYDPLIARLSDREKVDALSLPDVSLDLTIVRLDPFPDAPDLPPLPADRGWMLPTAIITLAAMALLVSLTRSRQSHD